MNRKNDNLDDGEQEQLRKDASKRNKEKHDNLHDDEKDQLKNLK